MVARATGALQRPHVQLIHNVVLQDGMRWETPLEEIVNELRVHRI